MLTSGLECEIRNGMNVQLFAFANGMLQIAINLKSNQLFFLRWSYLVAAWRLNGSLSLLLLNLISPNSVAQ
jgi:hypothetical protein